MRAPAWCKKAIPTLKGWAHHKTGEILKSMVITPEQIAEFYAEEAPVVDVKKDLVYEDFQVTSSKEFKELDLNSDGKITEVEFVEYKAVETKPKKTKKKRSLRKRMFKSDK